MDKFKDEELEFLARENEEDKGDLDLDSREDGDDYLSSKTNVFSDIKPIGAAEVKAKNKGDDFNPDDYLDKKAFKRMGIGLWLSENRKNILKAIVVILILISAGFFIFSIYNLVVYFKAGNPAHDLTKENISQSQSQIIPLSFSAVSVFSNNLKNDLAILIKNDNPRFYASFDYCFKKGETDLSCGENFILPSQEKYILAFEVEHSNSPGDFSFVISRISWNRISREILDYPMFYEERLGFEINDIKFSPGSSQFSANIDINNLEFYLNNVTPYSYYEVPLNILIFNGNDLRGINRLVIENFYTGENRRINLNWTADLRAARRAVIMPEIDIFDAGVFLRYRGN